MTDNDLYNQLTEVFRDIFVRDDIALTPEMTAEDVEGWDSFKMIEIVMAVESRFGIKVKSKELDELESVGDLVRLISASRLALND
ncbi:acyl carrier protein [Methylocystis sp. JAN1]|uniref:acyl carrier protein n=1 Tax=Methylocystis sp. JAN1 TaxID=3397211 RepID=UPI003FA33B2E